MSSKSKKAAFSPESARGEESIPLLQDGAQSSIMEQSGGGGGPAIEPEKESCWNKFPVVGGFVHLYDKYDATFLTMLGMQYFNQGTKVLVYLASADLFKAYYKLSPSQVQNIQSFVFLPWSIKILYGLISDNVPLFGSRRKSYLVLGALIQFITMIVLGLQHSYDNVSVASWMLFLCNLSIAFSDVIVDSLMVIQSRKYPDSGAEDLNSFSWACMSLGGFFGSIFAAFFTEKFEPRHCFLFSSVMGMVMAYVAYGLNVSLENEGRSLEDT